MLGVEHLCSFPCQLHPHLVTVLPSYLTTTSFVVRYEDLSINYIWRTWSTYGEHTEDMKPHIEDVKRIKAHVEDVKHIKEHRRHEAYTWSRTPLQLPLPTPPPPDHCSIFISSHNELCESLRALRTFGEHGAHMENIQRT